MPNHPHPLPHNLEEEGYIHSYESIDLLCMSFFVLCVDGHDHDGGTGYHVTYKRWEKPIVCQMGRGMGPPIKYSTSSR